MNPLPQGFAERLIAWQRHAGRHGLPWQHTRDPYRVWLSEIMLQQTQVSTVLDYYPRFLARFPDVHTLAAAPADDVMALWSGLGYYSRARHLHLCAQKVVAEHAGAFPRTAALLTTLPGIGDSTAAAVASFCFGERISILDGNVRRVLTRLLAYDGDQADAGPQKVLGGIAQALLPANPDADDMTAYTQGLMDLGATVCTRSGPRCMACPMHDICAGRASGEPTRFPVKSKRLKRRFERWWLLLITQGDRVWLQRRPDRGIWAGLYAPPVFDSEETLHAALQDAAAVRSLETLAPIQHNLTHRELQLLPMRAEMAVVPDGLPGQWVDRAGVAALGLPAPVRTLLAGAV